MISPAPGIHRPSYNGAPAKRTLTLHNNEAMISLLPGRSCNAPNSFCVATYAGAFAASLTSAFDKAV